MEINKPATFDVIRNRYRSIPKAAKAFGVSTQAFYGAISGRRGGKTHPAPKSEAVMKRLRDEDLLVEQESAPEVVNT